jgi:predicted nucleic acid-binding protein
VIVVDCAVIVDALTAVEGTDALRDVLAGAELSAPQLLDYEVVSALRGLTLRGHLSPARALDALTDYEELDILRWPHHDAFRRRAYQLRDTVSAYDAAYVVLAEALECPLVTRDRRLAGSSRHGARVDVL